MDVPDPRGRKGRVCRSRGLSTRRNIPDDITPGPTSLDVASLLDRGSGRALPGSRMHRWCGPELPAPKHIFATEVYTQAGILLRQLEELERRL